MNNICTELNLRTAASFPQHGIAGVRIAPLSVPSDAIGMSDAGVAGSVAADQRTRFAAKGAPPRGELR